MRGGHYRQVTALQDPDSLPPPRLDLRSVDELTLLYPGSWEAYRIPEDDAAAEEGDPDLEVDVPIIDPPPVDPPDLAPDLSLPAVDTDSVSLEPPKLDPLKPFRTDESK